MLNTINLEYNTLDCSLKLEGKIKLKSPTKNNRYLYKYTESYCRTDV